MTCIFTASENTFLPRRLASNCAYPRHNRRSRQLVSFEKQNSTLKEIRMHAIDAADSIRGYLLDHRGDRFVHTRYL